MTKKIIGIAALVIGVLGIFILLNYGGPVLPHIFGPTVLAGIGVVVLLYKKKVV